MAVYYDLVLSGKTVSQDINNGDSAYNTTVRNSAKLRISAGGYVENTTVHNTATVSNAGSAVSTFLSGGTMILSSGGVANSVDVLRNARLAVSGGAVATDLYVSGGNVNATVRGGDETTLITGTNESGKFYLSGGVASGFLLNSLGQLTVSSGGTALDTTIRFGGYLTVMPGGRATGIEQSAGAHINAIVLGGDQNTLVSGTNAAGIFCLSGGTASNFILYDGGTQNISSGGTALHTQVNGQRAFQRVWSGGIASATSAQKNGTVEIYEGGSARDTMIYSSGSMVTHDAADVSGAIVSGELLIDSAATGEDESGGKAVMRDIFIAAGGSMKVIKGADFHGEIVIGGNATLTDSMTLAEDASLVLSVSGRNSGSPAILSDWTMVEAADGVTFSVSTSASDHGAYKLADNAACFDKTLTVTADSEAIGELAVGDTFERDGKTYRLAMDKSVLTLTVTNTSSVAGDLNGDGRADIVMSIVEAGHGAEGATGAWLIQEDQTAAWGDLSQRNAGWEIFGTGLTTAGKTTNDVYVKSADNIVGAWTTDATGKVAGWETIGEFDAETQVLGLGDFNGDGQTDLLLRNDNGAVGCFFTSGDVTGWNYFQSLGEEWDVVAIGDLNGDGQDDVVLKNNDGGFAGSWLTQSDYTMAWANLDTLTDGFSIVGCGDFNGDGTDDVLLQKGSYFGAWIVENGSVSSWMGIGELGDVSVEQIGDFDADGIDDLRIRTTAGDLGAELVKGADTVEWKYYGSVGAEWSTSLAAI